MSQKRCRSSPESSRYVLVDEFGNPAPNCAHSRTISERCEFPLFATACTTDPLSPRSDGGRASEWSVQAQANGREGCRVQKNARRLVFIGENDSIQRLQLAKADGSEPEELDVDATLEDVIICMGNKHLVAIITPAGKPSGNGRPEAANEKLGPTSPMAVSSHHQKPKLRKDVASCYALPATPAALTAEDSDLATFGLASRVPPFKSNCEPPVRGLKITIPSSDPIPAAFHDERNVFGQDSGLDQRPPVVPQAPALAPASASAPAPRASAFIGEILSSNNNHNASIPGAVSSSISTPSPAELAHFLVKGSSLPLSRPSGGMCLNNPMYPPCHSAGFQTFASALISRLPVKAASNAACPSPQPNIALLVQFLASQLRAFIPVSGAQSSPNSAPRSPSGARSKASTVEVVPVATKPGDMSRCQTGDKPSERPCSKEFREGPDTESPKLASDHVKASVSESHEKDDSSSSANVNTTAAPSSDGLESETMQDRSELIFLVNRRSKTGVGTHHLKLSDLSAYFHLSVVDAAKKLGVSQTTLKKACRKFGLKRWPGRKVRSLESTIHGLEHTIAVGQGAGMEELTEAYMRSEVSKLQQEMDQLVHGTPPQHSPVARTADLYKRLYSRGWRSKYHSSCGRFDLDLNMDSRDSEGILSFTHRKSIEEVKPAITRSKTDHVGPTSQEMETNGNTPMASLCKDDSLSQTGNGLTDNIHDNASSFSKGVQLELMNTSTPDTAVDFVASGNRIRTQKLEELPVDVEVIELDREKDLTTERCPKRHKAETIT
ncbi:hypothetical protein Mp_1g11830 [Marchantia polymorpha subsp. ruderalis]|uniref:RWP-RK domain-containing protein n=2 Tax=Marchantia polymorpha TaxID=3197 RepID=A0AAF6AP55_MARPO|nr:RWP2 [Marchantia polymorpha]PTQ45497.1 hypothetical protein MARPO_0014s0044 [Marchantia polymorpha]BBM98225.1 hypothetical protein Mp_1g11830 [Marchantia polymorpha subsp. ruderalis]|eukprot:PTQ45497.1 hypothetical protein MARPO_0014s0044 [Marchantia polymorpha]